MDYDKVIELQNLTLEDCEELYDKGYRLVINSGIVTNIVKECVDD